MERKIVGLVESYVDSIKYYRDKISYSKDLQGGRNVGQYERELLSIQKKLDFVTNKYPEYLI